MQVNAAGDLCAICQEKMHAPILLRCKHIFCEDCVSEWLVYFCCLDFVFIYILHFITFSANFLVTFCILLKLFTYATNHLVMQVSHCDNLFQKQSRLLISCLR